MTKGEAITEMMKGNKVTHQLFSREEFIRMEDGTMFDECDYVMNWNIFWGDRNGASWETDWSIFK